MPPPQPTVEFRNIAVEVADEHALITSMPLAVIGAVPREDEEVVFAKCEGTVFNVQWRLEEYPPTVVVYVELDED